MKLKLMIAAAYCLALGMQGVDGPCDKLSADELQNLTWGLEDFPDSDAVSVPNWPQMYYSRPAFRQCAIYLGSACPSDQFKPGTPQANLCRIAHQEHGPFLALREIAKHEGACPFIVVAREAMRTTDDSEARLHWCTLAIEFGDHDIQCLEWDRALIVQQLQLASPKEQNRIWLMASFNRYTNPRYIHLNRFLSGLPIPKNPQARGVLEVALAVQRRDKKKLLSLLASKKPFAGDGEVLAWLVKLYPNIDLLKEARRRHAGKDHMMVIKSFVKALSIKGYVDGITNVGAPYCETPTAS